MVVPAVTETLQDGTETRSMPPLVRSSTVAQEPHVLMCLLPFLTISAFAAGSKPQP